MTEIYASIAIGTAATVLAAMLVLLRLKIRGQGPVVDYIRRWTAASRRTTGLVIGPLVVAAAACFANIPANEGIVHSGAESIQGVASASPALDSLRAYAGGSSAKGKPAAVASTAPGSVELPDVNAMISKLSSRLEKQPNDVKGWKMLGWSYLNTDRPEEAVKAYETALKLDSSDAETKAALDRARAAKTASIQNRD